MRTTLLLAVCILCGESKFESEFTGASSPALHSLIGTVVRQERQVGVCSDEELSIRLNTAVCDPHIGQRIVDIYLDCGNYTIDARRFIGQCSRNENGRFCFEFQQRNNLLYDHTIPLRSNCPSLNSYSNYECTDMCRAALRSLKSTVGCCLNSLFNISDYDRKFQLFNKAGLWSTCAVSPPSYCQATNLTLHSVITSHNCSMDCLTLLFYTQIYCDAQIYQTAIDIYLQCGRPEYYESLIAFCGLSETNKLCVILAFDNDLYPQAVESQCLNYTHGCTGSCHTALNTFKTAFGCCVNFYNNSILSYRRNITNPDLWSACGIPIPGFCPSTLSPQFTRSPVPSTTRVPTLSSQPNSSSEFNSVLSLDFPSITMLLLVLLSILVQM